MIKKINKESPDMLEKNILKLKQIFPNIFTEDKVDFKKLKEILGDVSTTQNENYSYSWAGRSDAIKNLQITSKNTLFPNKEDSKNFDNSKNILIEGENLDTLKLLQKSYSDKIKMIYIDPPYNTGNDFIYKDDFSKKLDSYLEQSGQTNEKGLPLVTNPETSGRFHSDWMSFLYPRIFLAHELLRDDGVIFVSIDDNELHNLRNIMNEIFGEENFIGSFVWRKKAGAGADSKLLFSQHEYVLFYAKNINMQTNFYQPLTDDQKLEYKNPDNDPKGKWAPTDLTAPSSDTDDSRLYEITSPTGKVWKKRWSYTRENFKKLVDDNLVWFGKTSDSMPKRKRYLSQKLGLVPRSWLDFVLTSNGKKDFDKLFGEDTHIFDYPKPVSYIKHFIRIASDSDSYVLDFFAGSGTTGQAVLELNKEDKGNRKFILIQVPEKCPDDSYAKKAGYEIISDICKDRIQKTIDSLNKETKQKSERGVKQDLGFKVFKLAKSNYKVWEDVKDEKKLKEQLKLFENPLIEKYNDIDVIYEIILKEGYSLNSKIEEFLNKPNKIYKVTDDDLFFYVTLEQKLDQKSIEKLNLDENTMFMCLDSALDDSQKTNLNLQCKLMVI